MATSSSYAIDAAIKVLNEALEADPEAVNALFAHRVKVNQALADHPTIQVWQDYSLRVMGLINGLFGCDEQNVGFIAMTVEKDGSIVRFHHTSPQTPETE